MLPLRVVSRKVFRLTFEAIVDSAHLGCSRSPSPSLSLSTSQFVAISLSVETGNRHAMLIRQEVIRFESREQ